MTTDRSSKFDPSSRRPRRLEDAQSEEVAFPIAWLIIGGLAGLIVIGLLGLGVVNIFRQQAITPTPQVLPPLVEEVPPEPIDSTSQTVEEPVVEPAPVEEAAAPDQAQVDQPAPEEADAVAEPSVTGAIAVNEYVRVTGTEGVGVSVRAGPGRNNARLIVADENEETVLLVLDGPREDDNAEDFIWWFVRHPDGTEGWVVEDFVMPAEAP